MHNKKAIIASAIAGALALTTTVSIAHAAAPSQEKCYGISKAGANDCSSGVNSCAGSATKNDQGDAFLLVPKGLCERITGGSLKEINGADTKKL